MIPHLLGPFDRVASGLPLRYGRTGTARRRVAVGAARRNKDRLAARCVARRGEIVQRVKVCEKVGYIRRLEAGNGDSASGHRLPHGGRVMTHGFRKKGWRESLERAASQVGRRFASSAADGMAKHAVLLFKELRPTASVARMGLRPGERRRQENQHAERRSSHKYSLFCDAQTGRKEVCVKVFEAEERLIKAEPSPLGGPAHQLP